MAAYRLTCPQFCELKSTLIHDKGINRILGSSMDPTGKWLDDEVGYYYKDGTNKNNMADMIADRYL